MSTAADDRSRLFNLNTLAALQSVATIEEIDQLVTILRAVGSGHVPPWQSDLVIEIINRLAQRYDSESSPAT
jgi:hypothetical protein